jgi:hypothetical protein
MRNLVALLVRLLVCIALAAGAYLWAIGLIDSLYAYRSPLSENPPQASLTPIGDPAERPTQRVVFILVDALRADTAADPQVMPFLNHLRKQGASATMHSRPPSYSAPGYSVLFTGAWPDISDGPAFNLEYEDIPTWTQDNLFSAAHRAGLRTAISAYYWFEKLVPQEAVDAHFYTAGEDQRADRQVVEAALPWLHAGDIQLVLIHIDQVDYAGHHEGGPRDPRWNEAARRADDLIAEIASALDLSQDTLLVLSDHGQIDRGGHGGTEAVVLIEPFVLAGAGVRPGNYGDIQMVDVAPTLAALLGANLPAASQGKVLTAMLDLPESALAALPTALEQQQAALLAAYRKGIGDQSLPLKPGVNGVEEIVGVYQAALENARQSRLNRERLLRLLPALAGALLPCLWLLRRSRRQALWLLAAGLVYLAAFNLRYAVVDRRTYSLSSVVSASDIITYSAITAGLALAAAWLVYTWQTQSLQQAPIRASIASLELTLAVLYLLSLPVWVSFWLNGFVPRWTLPHFPSMFLAFISLIQILIIAGLGLVLCAISAGLARWVGRQPAPTAKSTSEISPTN